ncbi:hypothetical protein BD770DRAFT_379408 [Pilaira anomala]|nr:hypothetical protein BD770DRAFT_379408 [Pilaira anomala]
MEDYKLKTRSITDLVLTLQDMDFDIAERDLTHPIPERTRILFEGLVTVLKPEKHEVLESLRARAAETCGIFSGSTDNCCQDASLIYTMFSEILKEIRFTDFELSDVINPTGRRIVPVINAIVNYALFLRSGWETYQKWNSEVEEIEEEIKAVTEKKEEVKMEHNYLAAQITKEKEDMDKVRKEDAQIYEELNEMKEEIDQLQSNRVMYKHEKESLKDVLDGEHADFLNTSMEYNRYKKYRDIDIEKAIAENEGLIIQIQDRRQKLEEDLKTVDNLNHEFALKEEITDAINQCATTTFNIKAMGSEISRQIKQRASMEEKLGVVQEQLAKTTDKRSKLKMEIANCDVEEEQLKEQRVKLTETKKLYFVLNEQKNAEFKKLLEDNAKQELEIKEEIKGIDQSRNELLYQSKLKRQQIASKITLISSCIEQKLGEVENMEDLED